MRKLLVTLLAVLLVATACSSTETDTPATGDPNVNLGDDDVRLVARLVPFSDCNELLSHLQAEARERVGPYGLDYNGSPWGFAEGDAVLDAEDGSAVEEPASEAALEPTGDFATSAGEVAQTGGDDAGGGNDFTGTNVQELGVDEPDIIKTDGDRIILIANNTLTYVDTSGDEPVITDQIRLQEGWGHELFFQGDRALLFSNGDWGYALPVDPFEGDAEAQFAEGATEFRPDAWFGPSSTIHEIDLSDPSHLEITSTLQIQGEYLSARRVGDTVRLALTSPPTQLQWVYPSNPAGEDRAERFNRELIDETRIEDWIPEFELTTPDGTTSGPLLDCNRLHRPAEFSGFDVVSVLSFDLDGGLDTGDGAGVLASGRTVYASTDRFYVATTQWAGEELTTDEGWREWSENYTTDVHAFSISTDEPAAYVASGSVPGSLLNQFSMDEYDGYLRIITTDGSPWDDRNQSETKLTVLDEEGDSLDQVGQVGGLGKGETLYASRLFDNVGFAVTFRQVDPFYVLDLRDPFNPTVSGELKIPGFSTYLHPVSETLVLGVGQDADERGGTQGLKVSLFDVSDPSDPREVATWKMPNGYSPVESDHRAFQFLADQRIAIVPAQSWNQDFNGAVLLQIGDRSIEEIGRVSHTAKDSVPTSDCVQLEPEELPQDTELFWMAQDGRVQFCDQDDDGGFGSWYCDPIPLDEIRFWGPEEQMNQVIDDLTGSEIGPEDRIEICFPEGGEWELQIQRSLVIGEELFTMSWAQLQTNNLEDLDQVHVLPL